MISRVVLIVVACQLLVMVPTPISLRAIAQPQEIISKDTPIGKEFWADRNRVDQFRQRSDLSKNLEGLLAVADELEKKWRRINHEWYGLIMLEVCIVIRNGSFEDSSRVRISDERIHAECRKYALLALSQLPAYSHQTEWNLLLHLYLSPLNSNSPSDIKEWEKERRIKVKLWLQEWQRREKETIKGFNFDDEPMLNYVPPPGINDPLRKGPSSIADPKLRKQYEESIKAFYKKGETYNNQYTLRRDAPDFKLWTKRYVAGAYSRRPYNLPELKRYLKIYVESAADREAILAQVRDNLATAKKKP